MISMRKKRTAGMSQEDFQLPIPCAIHQQSSARPRPHMNTVTIAPRFINIITPALRNFAVMLCTLFLAGGMGSSQAVGTLETAQNSVSVTLPSPSQAEALLAHSPFGINTAFQPDTPDLEARLEAMQQAGIK